MKKEIALFAAVLFCAAALAQAQEGDLHGAVALTYQSEYVWRGFNCFGSQMGAQPEVDLDLYDTGFGLNVQGHIPLGGGYVNFERWDYKPYYRSMMFKDEAYEIHYMLAYVYYNYPDHPTKGSGTSVLTNHADLQELHAVLSWPKLLGVEGLVPSYVPVKVWPSRSGSWAGAKSLAGGSASGWGHILMLDYAWTVPGFMPETPEQVINLHSELVYNDGFHPCGVDIDHEWSNVVFGASTEFDLGNNLSVTPGLYYQISMEEAVNDEDQFWATVGVKYKF